eukprot:gene21397-28355_t
MAPKGASKSKKKREASPAIATPAEHSVRGASKDETERKRGDSAATSGRGHHVQLTPLNGPPDSFEEMRARWAKPSSLLGRLKYEILQAKLRLDFILGPYFFDWQLKEVLKELLMGSLIIMLIFLIVYEECSQVLHAFEFISGQQ